MTGSKDLDGSETPRADRWQTGNNRAQRRGGTSRTHDNQIRDLANALTREIAEQVTAGDLGEAAAIVDANLVGWRKGKKGRAALAASPDAQRLLDGQEVPPLPPNWQTGSMRERQRGGDHRTHTKSMIALDGKLTDEIAEHVTAGDRDEAAAIVDANLISWRRPARGFAALAASPDAQRLLDEKTHVGRLDERADHLRQANLDCTIEESKDAGRPRSR